MALAPFIDTRSTQKIESRSTSRLDHLFDHLKSCPLPRPSGVVSSRGIGWTCSSTRSMVKVSPGGGGVGSKPLLGRSDRPMLQPSKRLSAT